MIPLLPSVCFCLSECFPVLAIVARCLLAVLDQRGRGNGHAEQAPSSCLGPLVGDLVGNLVGGLVGNLVGNLVGTQHFDPPFPLMWRNGTKSTNLRFTIAQIQGWPERFSKI